MSDKNNFLLIIRHNCKQYLDCFYFWNAFRLESHFYFLLTTMFNSSNLVFAVYFGMLLFSLVIITSLLSLLNYFHTIFCYNKLHYRHVLELESKNLLCSQVYMSKWVLTSNNNNFKLFCYIKLQKTSCLNLNFDRVKNFADCCIRDMFASSLSYCGGNINQYNCCLVFILFNTETLLLICYYISLQEQQQSS